MKKPESFLKTKIFALWIFSVVMLISGMLLVQSCQNVSMVADEDLLLKGAVPFELTLECPDEANAGEEFEISYSSTCGKIMIERGYIDGDPILNELEEIVGYEKIYVGLTCEMVNLKWEYIVDKEMEPCAGGTITQTWDEVGTYVYRVKVNQKANKNSGCDNCATFKGNVFQCFMVTVVEGSNGTFKDERDDNVYACVKIGDQIWMAENLAYLPYVTPETQYGISYAQPYYFVYEYPGTNVSEAKATSNYSTYGVLYNWPAALTACPDGWHLPSDADWQQLEITLGMTTEQADTYGNRGTDEGTQMKFTSGWYSDGNGNNDSGFSGLPGGYRVFDGYFYDIGSFGIWWSSTEASTNYGWTRTLGYNNAGVTRDHGPKAMEFSVRCVKNAITM